MLKKGLFIFLFVLLASHFSQRCTHGMTIAKFSKELMEDGPSNVDECLLDQPYRYFAKGGQAYVFLSEDGKAVLKLLRSSRMQRLRLMAILIPTEKRRKKLEIEQELLQATLKSYALAATELQEATGVLAIHLSVENQLNHPLKIVDKLGITHTIDPNKYPFVIQKKATQVKDKLNELMAAGDQKGAEDLLKGLFFLLSARREKGIEDDDPNLSKNFGFCGETPVQIDIGRFHQMTGKKTMRLEDSKEDLQHWINAHHPSLSEPFNRNFEEYMHEAL